MNQKKLYIKLIDLAFFLNIFAFIVNRSTTLGTVSQLIGVLLLLFLFFGKLHISKYHLLEIAFVVFMVCQVILGVAANPSATSDMIVTEIYCLIFSVVIYNYFLCNYSQVEFEKKLMLYIKISVIALITVLVFNFNTVLENGRLTNASVISIGGFGLLGGNSSTALAMQAMIPALFLLFCKNKMSGCNFNVLFYVLFLIAILTGTRKVLIGFALAFIAHKTILKKEEGTKKQLLPYIIKAAFVLAIISIAGYFLLIYVPFIRDNLGERVLNYLQFFDTGYVEDASIIVRNRLKAHAFDLFLQKPLYGWGMDYFRFSELTTNGYYSHNNFMELLSGGGLVGLFIYYSKYIYLVFLMRKVAKIDNSHFNKWFVCFCVLVLMVVLEFWQVTYFYRYIMIYQSILLSMLNISIHNNVKNNLTEY